MMTKVKINEVQDWNSQLMAFSVGFSGKIDAVQSSVKEISSMKSFSGNGAKSVKNYMNDTHGKLLHYYNETVSTFSDEVRRSLQEFSSQVDNSPSCVIRKTEIETFKNKVKSEQKQVKSALSSINKEFSKVSSICSVPKISDSDLNQNWEKMDKKIKEMFENLKSYEDSYKVVFALLNEQLDSLNQVKNIMGKISDGGINNYNLRNFNKLNNAWAIFDQIKDGAEYGQGLMFFEKCLSKGSLQKVKNGNGDEVWRVTSKNLYEAMMDAPKRWRKNTNYKLVSTGKGGFKDGVQNFFEDRFKLPDLYGQYGRFGKNIDYKAWAKSSVKSVGKGTLGGIKGSFNWKGMGKFGKGLAGIGVGMSAWDNFGDAYNDPGLSKVEAGVAGTINTVTDVGVSSKTKC